MNYIYHPYYEKLISYDDAEENDSQSDESDSN